MLLKTLLLFSFCLSLQLAAADCGVLRTVPIRLINDAAVEAKVMVAAQQEAAYVLKSLCVHLDWTAGSSAQALEMRTLIAPVADGITTHALGLTVLDAVRGNRGAIFLSRVRVAEAVYGRLLDFGKLLGCVLAHEIGHMLLNSNAHSPEGIMIANFGDAEMRKAAQRRLLFSRSDRVLAAAIR
jgi:hypothetical protein